MTTPTPLHPRILAQIASSAFHAARFETRTCAEPAGELHRIRSSAFVGALARELRAAFAAQPDVAVLSRDASSGVFTRNELLFDVAAVRYTMARSAVHAHAAPIPCVLESLVQVESELAQNVRHTMDDFNKLVMGSAPWSLFVGPLHSASECRRYRDIMATSASRIPGQLVVAFIPHPSAWPAADDSTLAFAWSRSAGDWERLGRPEHHHVQARMRLVATAAGFALEVERIGWRGHEPYGEWLGYHHWDHAPSEAEVCDAETRLFHDEAHFGTCVTCAERNPRGHMGGDECHGCMEAAGVVF
jgi:hypothetical protein